MAKTSGQQKMTTFTDFTEFVRQMLDEHVEGNWNEFIDNARDVAEKHYNVPKDMPLNSMYWSILGTMGDASGHVTLESVGGEEGLQSVLTQARDKAQHCENLIKDSLDTNGLFVHQRKGKDAPPPERFIELKQEKGALMVLGAGGQGFVLYGVLKQLPYETIENFYTLLVSRDKSEDPDFGRKQTAQITKGQRTKKDKALKLRRALLNEWKMIFEKEGYKFEARKHFGRHVAVKVFPQQQLTGVNSSDKEAKFIGWPNAHVMPILAKGAAKNGVSIVIMPYIDMSNSVSTIQINRLYCLDDVITIMDKLARALSELHKAGLIHRDLKPDNIIVTREKSIDGSQREVLRPVITDFGLASVPEYTAYSISNTLKGTPKYLPPEQGIDSKRAMPQSDMYALGLWLYELLGSNGFNPSDEQLPGLINRIWRLSRGDIFYTPPIPSAAKFNIVHNEIERTKFPGIFSWFKRRKFAKQLYNKMYRLEQVMAGMLITGNAQPIIDRCSKDKDYQSKLKTKHRIEYADLSNEHKEEFIQAMVAPRYADMDALLADLKRIQEDQEPEIPDYRNKLFSKFKRRGRFLRILIAAGVLTGLTALGLGLTGNLNQVLEFIKGLFGK